MTGVRARARFSVKRANDLKAELEKEVESDLFRESCLRGHSFMVQHGRLRNGQVHHMGSVTGCRGCAPCRARITCKS